MGSFYRDARNVYQVTDWLDHHWLDHGFGTRHSDGWIGRSSATLKQIHSDTIVRVNEPGGCLGSGDALITDRPGVHLCIRTADCIPILLVDPVRRAVAAVHAGWRGTAASIAAKTVERLHSDFGSDPENLMAAIGPGIGYCCYEVGREVALQFGPAELEVPSRINLTEINRRQLAQAGVGKILTATFCTRCELEEFHSFRRDGDLSGRMTSGVAILTADEA